ncbi:MAG: hypothetical protein INR66_13060 [Gordonia polyisoprenivorans]|nr:hypothetical protein [Gordonia polyisoprenivorans]
MNEVFDVVAPALVGLDLLSDEDLDRARALRKQAREYQTLARTSEQAVARKVSEVAEKLAADAKTTPDRVIAATTGIPDARAVTAIAESMERSLNKQAQSIVLARVGEACGRLNARLAEIADETESVARDLSHIDSPQAAIDSGRVDEWRRAQALMSDYETISALIYQLRELRVIPRPKSSQSGSHWMFLERHEEWVPKDATPWQKHVAKMKRRPWIPASADEAESVFAQWQREAVSA